ncbi:adenylate kinase-domain-containing protein, partial [Chaetomium sp. MPI-CAGE-AT-0009]
GAPGAGKGTLSKQLASDNGFTHISIGDLLREKVNRGDDQLVSEFVKNNELLPSAWLLPIMRDAISAIPDDRPIILDGFPRCFSQALDFEEFFAAPALVLFFHCAEDVAKERVVNRNDGREGDNSEVFDKRYLEYISLNPKVLD